MLSFMIIIKGKFNDCFHVKQFDNLDNMENDELFMRQG